MGLPDVLSAVRQLILDGIDLPACAGDRQKLYAIRFQGLSADELEDLAQMDPARLGLYTRSIFAAEGRMLTSYFPLTLHLLKRGWPHGIYSARELAHRIHGVAPWRGIHSPSLGTCLGEFIQHGRAWTIEPMPYIEDVYRYEQASLEIRKAPNEDPRPHGVERLRDAASVSVEEMLSWKAYVPSLLHVEQFRYDVRAACSEFMSTGEVNKWRQRPHWLAAARPVDYGVSWYEVSPQFADFFRRVRGETVRVGDIACGYLSDAQRGDDAEDFRRFFTALQACVVCGIVSLAYD